MKKLASILMTVVVLCAVLALPASAAGVRVAIEPDADGNLILDSTGSRSVADSCNVGKLEVKSGTIVIGKGIKVTVDGSVVVAEGATLEIVGQLELSEKTTAQNDGTVNLVCCGEILGNASVLKNVVRPIHKFDCGETCLYCTAKCPHQHEFTFCLDCGTVLNDVDTSKGLSFNLPAGESAGTIGPAANPQTGGLLPVVRGSDSPSVFTGSTLSEGSLTIIVGVACLVVGFLTAMVIFKKKKPAVADGE